MTKLKHLCPVLSVPLLALGLLGTTVCSLAATPTPHGIVTPSSPPTPPPPPPPPSVVVTPGSISGGDLGDNPTVSDASQCSAVVNNPPVTNDEVNVDGPHWKWSGTGSYLDDGTPTPDPSASGTATFALSPHSPDSDSTCDYTVVFDSPGDYILTLTATATYYETILQGPDKGKVTTVSFSGQDSPGIAEEPDPAPTSAIPQASPRGSAAPNNPVPPPTPPLKVSNVLGPHYEIVGSNEVSYSNASDAGNPKSVPETRSHTAASTDSVVDIKPDGTWTGFIGAGATPAKMSVAYHWSVSGNAVPGHPLPSYTGSHINAYFQGQTNPDSVAVLGATSSIKLTVSGVKWSYNYGIKWHLPFEAYELDPKFSVNPKTIFSEEAPDTPASSEDFPAKTGIAINYKNRVGDFDSQSLVGAGLIFADLSDGLVEHYTENPLYLALFAAVKAGGDNVKDKLGEKADTYTTDGASMFTNGMDTKNYGCTYNPKPVFLYTSMGIAHFNPDIGSYRMNNVRMEKVEATTFYVGDAFGSNGYTGPDHKTIPKVIKEYPVADFFIKTTNE